jgi:PBP1b-binding outer membrane lipoprotein LpoB
MKIISTVTCILLSLNGCTILAQNLGATATTVQLAQGTDTLKMAADMVSTANSGKTITDHATPADSKALSSGVREVFVNGIHTIRQAKLTGDRAGVPITRGS